MRTCIQLTLFLFLGFQSILYAQEIAQWRGPNRDGVYPDKNLLDKWPEGGPQLLWKYDSLGFGYSSAAVTSKNVYTVGTLDSISYVFNFEKNGKLLWKKPLGREWMVNWPGIRSTPTIYKGLGYVINGLGVLYCFDANTGNVVWVKDMVKEYQARNLEYGFCDNLVVDGDKVFCTPGGIEANVVALNRNNGDLIWKSPVNSDSVAYSNPTLIDVGQKKFFVNATMNTVFALNTLTGELAWEYPLKLKWHPNSFIYRDGFLYLVDGAKVGSLMLKTNNDGNGVNLVWENPKLSPVQGDAILLGDRLYGFSVIDKIMICADWKTGNEIYTDSLKAQVLTVAADKNNLYLYGDKGDFSLLKPTEIGFEKCGSFKVSGGSKIHCSHPVIDDGRLYIRHDNSLFVYNISK